MTLTELLGVEHPVLQSPMAGVQTNALVAAVSNAGGLGTIAAATLSAGALRDAIGEVRAATARPFGVNLFAPPYLRNDVLDVVLDERPHVFSFTFGVVDPTPLRERGIVVLGTATTVEEARALEQAGIDVVVAQGAEAGGHRGTFLGSFEDGLVPLAELVPAVAAAVSVPVVAAGGIVDRAGAAAAFDAGAQGVQAGTAFLFTPECATPPAWLEALRRHETVVTPAYTGRHARGARTPFLEELIAGPPPLPFPEQRRAVRERGGSEDGNGFYLGGLGAARARERPAAEVVRELAGAAR